MVLVITTQSVVAVVLLMVVMVIKLVRPQLLTLVVEVVVHQVLNLKLVELADLELLY